MAAGGESKREVFFEFTVVGSTVKVAAIAGNPEVNQMLDNFFGGTQ